MRVYFGCTSHYIQLSSGDNVPVLSSSLLCCERFKGSHTGESIAEFIDKLVDDYAIRHKIVYILSDNAANMKKAFRLAFPERDDEADVDQSDEDDIDNSELWNALNDEEQQHVEAALDSVCHTRRLACFAHTEQLVVGDGLKQLRCVRSLIGKCSKLSSTLHTSAVFTEKFEEAFGKASSIPAENATRWHSTLRQLRSILDLDQRKLEDVLKSCGHDNLILTGRESSQLLEVVNILLPFLEATDVTQGK